MNTSNALKINNTTKLIIQHILSRYSIHFEFRTKNQLTTFIADIIWIITNDNNQFSPKNLYGYLHFFESKIIRGIIYPTNIKELILELIEIHEACLTELHPINESSLTNEVIQIQQRIIIKQILRILLTKLGSNTEITDFKKYRTLLREVHVQSAKETEIVDKDLIKKSYMFILSNTIRGILFPTSIEIFFLELLQMLEFTFYMTT